MHTDPYARLKWRTQESLTCFAAAIRFLSFIGLSRWIVDQIDLALLTLRFLARVQFLRESPQLYRSAAHLPHDTSYLSCAGSWCRASRQPHREHRALARFACHGHIAAHHARKLAGDRKAKPRPAVAACCQGIGLGEILEQFRLLFGGHADAGKQKSR